MLGIIIGVAAVIIIVAIGQGTKKQMTDELFATDKNAIQIYYEYIPPEGEEGMFWQEPELTTDDVQVLADVPGVKAVLATNQGWGMLRHDEVQGEMQITGVGAEFFPARDIQVVEGRALYAADNDGLNRVVLIDTIAREKFFKETENPIGEIIDLNENPYKVVGVYESPLPEQFRNKETGEMIMPRAVISMMFGNREIEQLSVIASDSEKISETGRLAAETLTETKKLEDGMYSTNSFEDYEKELNTMISLLTLLIGSICSFL